MNLGELWLELEQGAPSGRDGRVVQRLHPDSGADIFAGVEIHPTTGRSRRTLELQVDESILTELQPPKGTRQVKLFVDGRGPKRAGLVLALEDPGAGDLFAAMCTDVADATAPSSDPDEAVAIWVGRFAKWRRMLQQSTEGLSARRQRGLFAELVALRDELLPVVGFDEAVLAWKGPDGAPRDFEISGLALEVKSSAANEPQVAPVHGERQLDDHGLSALVLLHQSLEIIRDADSTLPVVVAELRVLGEGRAEAGTFEDRLLQSGYCDIHAASYRRTGYEMRRTSYFQVEEGFPRITEADLRDGVGSVRYALAVDACRSFEVDPEFLQDRLKGLE